ncbi:MAG: hypothetical protein AAGE94_01920 [Acidobacteriota bacterium]
MKINERPPTAVLLGAPATGRSTLFLAMLARCHSRRWSGALAPLLGPGAVHARRLDADADRDTTDALLDAYLGWQRLDPTEREETEGYRLELPYRAGWLGRATGRFQLELWSRPRDDIERQRAIRRAEVLFFALPLWAAFPSREVKPEDRAAARHHLDAFRRLVTDTLGLRETVRPPRSILVILTMADDARCALVDLQDAWIHPVLDAPRRHLDRLRQPRHLLAYLHNARRVSDYLRTALTGHGAQTAHCVDQLDALGVRPSFLPVSAIEGRTLERAEAGLLTSDASPTPAHVELPLLLALCAHSDALR